MAFNREVELLGSNGQRVRQKAMPALDNYDFDAPNLPPQVKRLRTLARVARDQGQLNRSQLYDILEVDERNNAYLKSMLLPALFSSWWASKSSSILDCCVQPWS